MEREIVSEALRYLEQFDLLEKSRLKAGELSYGERRIVSLLRVNHTGAGILLLHEPFANLNVLVIERLKGILDSLTRQEKRSIILIEHRPDNFVDLVDALFLLHDHKMEIHEKGELGEERLSNLVRRSNFHYE
jgi:ABC-type branched-subunit amino acid transport system ATPase component